MKILDRKKILGKHISGSALKKRVLILRTQDTSLIACLLLSKIVEIYYSVYVY